MNKYLLTLITSVGLLHSATSMAQCVVGGTDFDTSTELCAPILESNGKKDGGGWYDQNLDWETLCKGDMFVGADAVIQKGLLSNTTGSSGSLDMNGVDKIFLTNSLTADASGVQYGKSTVTAQPKLINSFLKANTTANNMFVNVGGKDRFPLLSYSMAGLEPGSTVTLTCDVYDLFDVSYFRFLNDTLCKGTGAKVPQMQDFMAGYNYVASTKEIGGGNKLEFAICSSADVKPGSPLFDSYNQNMLQRNNLSKEATSGVIPHGGSKHMTFSTKVPETGSLTFYFYKTSDCYKIPIGIDNIEIIGSIKPSITYTGNPCPEMPLRVFTKQTYPKGTKISWKESVTGQTSTDANFNFVPKKADTDYTVTCEVTLPGCSPAKSEPLTIHSGTCCTTTDGAPMAMTNLFFDDFGNFVSDDTYEWTDRYGVTHTEKIPAGSMHYAQSISNQYKTPCVRAYNIESTGAKLKVPYLRDEGANTELYNHGMYVVSAHGGYPSGVQNDNSGTTTGGMLQFDLLGESPKDDGPQDEFFEIDVEHICTGKEITFGADFASISEHPGCIEVQLLYGNEVLEKEGKSFTGGSDGWKSVSKKFTVDASKVGGASEVTIKMKVKHDKECAIALCESVHDNETRDYAIDNIVFSVCTPPDVNVESSVSTGKDILDLCTEDVLTLTSVTSDAVKRFYLYSGGAIDPNKKVGYVYQYTFQDPATESEINKIKWTTLHKNAEVLEQDKFDVDVETYWDDIFSQLEDDPNHEKRIYFRVVVGEYSDLVADQSWKTTSAFSSCRKISISTIPVVAGLNCAACTKPDPVEFSAEGGKFNATKKTVELCTGESVTLGMVNAVHGIDKNNNDYSNYDVKWYKEDVTSAAIESKKCVTGTDDAAPTITVDYADVEDAGEDGVKYIISLHDYFDPKSPTTSCDITDTITVIGNPKPKETLDNPDPFCEGTLDADAEPKKTIAGFEIAWYADADTATKADEPVIGTLKKEDMPKSYYYVLTDSKTGCRGEANEYKIEVNKADENNVDNSKKIEYKKTDAKSGSLKTLDQQNGSVFKAALTKTGYTLMIGLVNGADEATAPSLSGATLGAASDKIPAPTVKDADSSDDEYAWYYTYLKSAEGCLSDTLLVGVVIKGAPSPKTVGAAYCVNSADVKPMSAYASPADEDPDGKLIFYGTNKTTLMEATDLPDVSKPGKYTYWVSQESSTGGGMSSQQPIEIEVYGVNDVDLAKSSDKYCKGSEATALNEIASVKSSSDEYVKNSGWEFFEGKEPALNEETSGAEDKMAVSTKTAGEYKYYARLKYEIAKSSEVCYGKHVEYTVEVQSVADPVTGTVSYTKKEGESGGFKLPTEQTPDAIVGDADCSDCSIVWYKEDKTTKITEAEATPKYADVKDLEGNKDYHYYVKQVNALGCESEFMPVTIIVSGYPTPIVKNISVCENSDKLKGTIQATAQEVKGGASAEDFTLVWYKSKNDGTMDDSEEFTEITLSPSEQPAATDGSKTKTYKYYVLQRLGTSKNDQSAAVMVTVTVYANPKLTKLVTDPKCKGESQKLSEMYDIDLDGCDATHYDANSGTVVTLPSDVVTDAGLYEVKGWYIINKGTSEEETCSSQEEDLTVVFHELEAEIDGSDRTCPGVSVDLKAVTTVGGGLKESELYYDWKNDLNGETGSNSTYKTGADGLDAAEDKMTVTLEVSSDACKGSRAVKKTKVITVGDGPLVGKIAFSEAKNTSKVEKSVSSGDITFNSCGGDVSVELSGIVNKNGGEYTLSGDKSQSGKFSSETSGSASLSLGEGKYTLEYVNECPTKFEFEIIDYSNTATATNGKMTICENEEWSAEILEIKGPKPTIKWIHGTDTIAGESGTKLAFKPAKPENSGKYSYTLLSAGCKYDGKIALGDELKVKPYAVLDNNSYKKYYEVVNGDGQDITLGFKVPADASEVESDIKWSDPNTGFKETGASLSIQSVETDYNLHVTVENNEYCKAETDIEIKVDARLKIEALLDKLDGSSPSTKIEICEDETAKLVIDTFGTGKVLHPEQLTLKVTETTSDGTKNITLVQNRNTKMLEAEVSPKHDAKYDVTYEYAVGSQSLPQELSINVHEKFQVEWEAVEPVCEGDVSSIVITKVYPDGTDLDWTDNLAEMSVKGSLGGASAEPKHTNDDPARQITTVKVIAKNGLCQDKAYMIPVPVDKPIEGEILSPGKICQYDELSLDASSFEAETYEWTYVEKDSSFTGAKASLVPEPDYATFVLNMKRGTCSKPVEKTVEVTSAPSVDRIDSLSIRKIEIVMESNVGTEPFRYIIDGNEDDPEILNPIRDGLEYKEHVVKVVDEVGCTTEYKFVVNNPSIEIPFLVSPDGNGINDKFIVKGLAEGYPDAKVTIFDRWGKKLASYRAGDDTDWDGVYNGSKMPSTDYWYEIQIKEIKKTYTGHFTLIRQ